MEKNIIKLAAMVIVACTILSACTKDSAYNSKDNPEEITETPRIIRIWSDTDLLN